MSREQHVPRTPEGWLAVYVGPDRERVVIRTELVNHPLFKELLDEAELEYGHKGNGPIELPCRLDHFDQVLLQVQGFGASSPCRFPASPLCGFASGVAGYRVLDPSTVLFEDRF